MNSNDRRAITLHGNISGGGLGTTNTMRKPSNLMIISNRPNLVLYFTCFFLFDIKQQF